jgi:hypothetical protein
MVCGTAEAVPSRTNALDHGAIADAALASASSDFSASPGFSALINVSPIRNAR